MRVNEQKITTTKYSETHSNMDAYERLKTQTHNAMTNTLCSPICLVIATMRLVVQRCSRKDASAIYCAQHKHNRCKKLLATTALAVTMVMIMVMVQHIWHYLPMPLPQPLLATLCPHSRALRSARENYNHHI